MRPRLKMLAGTAMDPYACLRCGYLFDHASGVGSDPAERPSAGSVSLCIHCGDVAMFLDAPPWLRPATDEERREIEGNPELHRVRRILAAAILQRPS
jgi:hypothetical protein